MEIEFRDIQVIDPKRQLPIWFDGAIKEFKLPELQNVDKCQLVVKHINNCKITIIDTDESVEFTINKGLLRSGLRRFINNDRELVEAMSGTHEKYKVDLYENIEFAVRMIDRDGHDSFDDFQLNDSSTVEEAINEINMKRNKIVDRHCLHCPIVDRVDETTVKLIDCVKYRLSQRLEGTQPTDEDIQSEIRNAVTSHLNKYKTFMGVL